MPRLLHSLFLVLALPPFAHARAADPGTIAVLTYHRFHPTTASAATVVTTPVFARQMAAIAAQGMPVLTLRAMLDVSSRPARAVVITADDGNRSVYTEMFPILRRHGFAARCSSTRRALAAVPT